MPFANDIERDLHFAKHGHKFRALDAFQYETMADQFMFGALSADTRECIRPSQVDRVRFGFVTHYQGIACMTPEFVRTFYPVKQTTIARRGGEAGYFAYECSRIGL